MSYYNNFCQRTFRDTVNPVEKKQDKLDKRHNERVEEEQPKNLLDRRIFEEYAESKQQTSDKMSASRISSKILSLNEIIESW
mmetsp:Transcript_13968/g.21775  ORF Transcript_13968/g.21775 Transcript_13968/m.21775 type:complete len:82 (-) Transcript_13968:1650-1895(-)